MGSWEKGVWTVILTFKTQHVESSGKGCKICARYPPWQEHDTYTNYPKMIGTHN